MGDFLIQNLLYRSLSLYQIVGLNGNYYFYWHMINNTNLREYSQKAILNRMPTDFIGIAKEYSSVKKQRIMSQQLFDSYHHEVSSIEKINKSLAKSLNKKKKELKYVQAVRSRYVSEVMQKAKLEELRQLQLSRLKSKTMEERIMTDQKLAGAKEKLMYRKKTECDLTKKELSHYKSQKLLEQSRLFSKNQSRVQQIQEQKARIKDYYNRFFQNKNRKFMQNYKKMIKSQKQKEEQFKTQTKNLEKKLLLLKQDARRKEDKLAELNSSIDSLKESRTSLRSSSRRGTTTRTMTPMQILIGVDNPERAKLKLLIKN